MGEKQGTKEGQYMHESISEDAVKYDMDSEQIISALCEDNETLQAENKRLRDLLAAVESVYPGRFKIE